MSISINIVAGATKETSSISAKGSEYHIITDSERNTFSIGSDSALKNAIGKYFGKNPNDAFLHSPTPWGDLYKTYGWPQVQTMLTVESATITEITSKPVIIATKTFTNNSSHEATFNAGISDQVSNTTESNWSNSSSVSFSQSVSYGISFLGTGGGGETSFSYTQEWGRGGSKSQTVTVGTDSGVSVVLQPGESVKADLTASRGVMKVRIAYNASLSGDSAVNYNPTFKGHHFWGLGIAPIVNAAGNSNRVRIVEDIEIGYYSNSEIIITDVNGKKKQILNATAGIENIKRHAPEVSIESSL